MMVGAVPLVVLTAVSTAAAVSDVRSRRIPNALTYGLAIAAVAWHALGSLPEAANAVATMMAVFSVGTIAFAQGWFGGGDVKLLAACAAVVGSHGVASLLVAVFAAGGALAVLEAVRRRRLVTFLRSTAGAMGGVRPIAQFEVPYGVAIAAGSLLYSAGSLVTAH